MVETSKLTSHHLQYRMANNMVGGFQHQATDMLQQAGGNFMGTMLN